MADFDVVIENVDKTFPGNTRAVINFNAEIEHGEFVSMLGPSGCGKTTLAVEFLVRGAEKGEACAHFTACLLYTSPSPRD
mgnify:CR=1 FL=1